MVADELEPGELFVRKRGARLGLVREPFVEPLVDGFREGPEHGLLFEREPHQRNQIGEASRLRAAFDLAGRSDGAGIPQPVFGPGGVVFAQFLFQFLQHRLGEALLVRAAVEDLQGVDLGLVLLDVGAEGTQEALGLLLRGGIEALVGGLVDGDAIDDLLGGLLGLGQRIAQDGRIERRAGFLDQLLPGLFQKSRSGILPLVLPFPMLSDVFLDFPERRRRMHNVVVRFFLPDWALDFLRPIESRSGILPLGRARPKRRDDASTLAASSLPEGS